MADSIEIDPHFTVAACLLSGPLALDDGHCSGILCKPLDVLLFVYVSLCVEAIKPKAEAIAHDPSAFVTPVDKSIVLIFSNMFYVLRPIDASPVSFFWSRKCVCVSSCG